MVKCVPSKIYMELLGKMKSKNDSINDQINITETEIKIIELVKQNNQITRMELANTLKVNESTIKRTINKVKNKGILKRIGANKNGHWEIIKK